MSDIIERSGVKRILLQNTTLQKANDEYIQQILNKYKYYDEKDEFYKNTGKDADLIISHKPTIPDLVIYNKPFNKNECFKEGNMNENNLFPRKKFFIKFNEKDREQFEKYNLKKQKKENVKKDDNKLDKNKVENKNKTNKKIEIKNEQIKIQEIDNDIENNSNDINEEKIEEKEEKNNDKK